MVLRNLARHPLRAATSVVGIGFAVATLMIGLVLGDAIDRLIETQFTLAERQDVTVTFVEPRSESVRYALAALPGVIAVEPQRSVAARIRAGHHDRYLAITGVPRHTRLRQIVDLNGRVLQMPPSGVVISQTLADVLGVRAGDEVTVEVLEGMRPVHRVLVTGLVPDIMGLSVYMDMDALHRLMREGLVDEAQNAALSRTLKAQPVIAGAGFKDAVLRAFREIMAANMAFSIAITVVFASIIAVGVVYNAARVSLSERSRELASLRVLGFTRAEISLILLGELALLTVLSLPLGASLGYALTAFIVQTVESEVYRFPMYVAPQAVQAVAWACLGVIAAALVSGLIVRRRLDRLDLVAVLKIRE
jgi:putative ABC transport system permease protein